MLDKYREIREKAVSEWTKTKNEQEKQRRLRERDRELTERK